jgi:RHS repeat-associated protein
MLVETSKRAHVANPAAAQLPRSPKKRAFEGVVRYYGYRYYDPETGRWPSRDPIGEMGGVNLYGFCYNDSFGWYDYLGWNPQSKGGYTPKSKRPKPTPIGEATLPIRKAIGAVGGVATGDIFHAPTQIPGYSDDQCKFLITVAGINMWENTQKEFLDGVRALPAFSDIPVSGYVNNPANYPIFGFGIGDTIQCLINEIPVAPTLADTEMAKQIKAAAEKAKENGCCCWSIHIVAHSQGTMITRRALEMIDAETKKHIHITGLGGQTIFTPDEGLGSVANLAEKQDWVPKLQPLNWQRHRTEFDYPVNKMPAAHGWKDVYLRYLKENPSIFEGRGDCE